MAEAPIPHSNDTDTVKERHMTGGLKIAVILGGTVLVLTACTGGKEQKSTSSSGQNGNVSQEKPDTIQEAYEQGIANIKQHEAEFSRDICMRVYTLDSDCDGVLNKQDLLPNEPDFGDHDSDLIPNAADLKPRVSNIQNGRHKDSDGDRLWDDLDSYWGNNFADDDRDGILNGHDRQPKVAAPSSSRNAQDDRIQDAKTGEMIVVAQMRNQAFRDYLSKDLTIAPTLPHPLLTDSDRDGFNDYYDPLPRNPYIHQKNDVYTVGSDAWHEKQQEKKRQNTPTTRFCGKALIDLDGKKSVVELADS